MKQGEGPVPGRAGGAKASMGPIVGASASRPTLDPEAVWASLTEFVVGNLGDWRREVAEAVGMPFSRIRILRRLASGPLTMKGLADAAGIDAPAATVSVNDLERRRLVTRIADPQNRRVKVVAITAEGRRVLVRADTVRPTPPVAFSALTAPDLAALAAIMRTLGGGPAV